MSTRQFPLYAETIFLHARLSLKHSLLMQKTSDAFKSATSAAKAIKAKGEAGALLKTGVLKTGALKGPTLKDEVVRLIEEEIISGALPPGTRLDEVQLSARFGLSRTPLREALAQLTASGLLEARPRSGTFVTRLGIKSILECLAMTAEIEAIAAEWASRRMSDDEIRGLRAMHEACGAAEKTGSSDSYFLANRRFHAGIYAGAHNRYVAETANFLFMRAAPYRRLQLRQPGRIRSSSAEHGAIVDAIAAREGETAKRIMRDHILIQGDRFMEFISMLPDSFIGLKTD